MTTMLSGQTLQQLPELQKASHEQLSQLIDKQWTRMWAGGVLLVFSVLGVIAASFWLMRSPEHPAMLDKLEKSSERIAVLAQGMSQGCTFDAAPAKNGATGTPQPLCIQALETIRSFKAEQQAVLKEFRAQDAQPKPEAISLVQIVGGTAILAILGYLGLIRLQNLDQELGALRSFMFEQIKSRVEDQKAVVKADVVASIQQEFVASQKHIEEAVTEAQLRLENAKLSTEMAANNAINAVGNVERRLTDTIEQYPWLSNTELSESLSKLSDIPSVAKAHELAEQLRETDPASAIAVLKAIIERSLPGNKDDFHNAHSEAMRLQSPALALGIVEKGLESFADDYDLMPDRAIALLTLGRPGEAKIILDDWKKRKPSQFARGWRPVVFYSKVVEATDLSETAIIDLENAFIDVISIAPYEDKVWSAYGGFLRRIGRYDDAEKVLKDSISKNPYSQILHFVYGEFLLVSGRAEAAVRELELAIRVDFQDQFQPDVNQAAMFGMMGQAYEAAGNTERAKAIYAGLGNSATTIGRYAMYRLSALSILSGEGDASGQGEDDTLSRLAAIMGHLKSKNVSADLD